MGRMHHKKQIYKMLKNDRDISDFVKPKIGQS